MLAARVPHWQETAKAFPPEQELAVRIEPTLEALPAADQGFMGHLDGFAAGGG